MSTRRVDLALLAVALVWGSSYAVARVATDASSVLDVLFWRYALAAVLALGVCRWRRELPDRGELTVGAVLGVTQAAVLLLETAGVARTSPGNAGVLISLSLLTTPLFEWAFGARRPTVRFVAAVLVSSAGVALLVGGGGFGAAGSGDLLVLGAALVRGAHVALVGRLASTARPVPLTTVQLMVGAAGCGALGRGVGGIGDGAAALAVIYLAVGCSLFAFGVQTWAVQRTSPSRASLLLGTEPLWAVGVAVLVGSARPGAGALLGATLVIGGTWWGRRVIGSGSMAAPPLPGAGPGIPSGVGRDADRAAP